MLSENDVHRVSMHYHAILMWMRISEMHLKMTFSVVRYIIIFKSFSDAFF